MQRVLKTSTNPADKTHSAVNAYETKDKVNSYLLFENEEGQDFDLLAGSD
jgi:hypothetical protein